MTRLLDLTRSVNRAGLVATGVDRVERAYLAGFLDRAGDVPCWGLVRTALGFVLLDAAGMLRLLAAIEADKWPAPDAVSRWNGRLTDPAQRGQTLARRLARARCLRGRLAGMLARRFPRGLDYFTVGHSNLNARTLEAVKAVGRVHVLIHDTIPLDFPQFQRVGEDQRFARKLDLVGRHADRVICTSAVGAQDLARHLTPCPPVTVAHLGVAVAEPAPDYAVPEGPYFVTLGTIEPRKNHALLLDIWDRIGPGGPRLVILGRRGWRNDAVFARLDAAPAGVIEIADLPDAAVSALLRGSRGLLFPSKAEGYGLPPLEAAALGCAVLCADLPIYGELLGKRAVYLPPDDRYVWMQEIEKLAGQGQAEPAVRFVPPQWDDHFKCVLSMT